jgi:hypothetical protein
LQAAMEMLGGEADSLSVWLVKGEDETWMRLSGKADKTHVGSDRMQIKIKVRYGRLKCLRGKSWLLLAALHPATGVC